jgi:hypothetical protein
MGDITFFAKNKQGNLRCLSWDASADLIAEADGTTMKLTTRRMVGRESVSTRRQIGTQSIAPSGHWADNISIFAQMGLLRKPSSWHTSTKIDAMMSPWGTSAQLSSRLQEPLNIPPSKASQSNG